MRASVVLLLKEPRPGRVKTRLAREIGTVAAARWFRLQSAQLIRRIAADPRWNTALAVAPDTALESRAWPRGLTRVPQGRGDLGDRMGRVIRGAPPGPVLIVGGDIPGVTPARVAEALALLGPHDAVLGPAEDGGYWCVGLRHGARAPAGLFADVRWSGPHAMADTARSLRPLRIGYAACLGDVDEAADLCALGLARARLDLPQAWTCRSQS